MSESKTEVHFINVGQGNMTLIICENGAVICYDCNITDDNEKAVFSYLRKIMPKDKKNIDVFIASHRDKDHINGIEKLNKNIIYHKFGILDNINPNKKIITIIKTI